MATKYMVAVNFFKYFIRLLAYSLYCVCWACASVLDFIINRMMVENHQSTMKTAQLGRILWRQKFSIMSLSSQLDFFCMFRTLVRPEYVLRPNVSLYIITRKEAIFVEIPESFNIYSSDVHPFFFVAQFLSASKVIKISIRDFVSLADKIGDPTVPVIWMSNTGRCGGTMLCQVFETVPGTLVIHEPDSPTNLYHLLEDNKLQASEYEVMLKSMIRILCKPHPGITRFCIKPRPLCTIMMTDITKLGFDIRQLFIYRNSLDTLKSSLALMAYDPYTVVVRACVDAVWFSNLCPYFRNVLVYHLLSKMKDAPEIPPDSTTACVMTYIWVNQILIVRDVMARNQSILPVKYEDIVSRPKETVKQIFERLGVHATHANRAVASLSRDSQRGSDLSRDRIGGMSNRFISTLDRMKANDILFKYNLPRMDEDFRI